MQCRIRYTSKSFISMLSTDVPSRNYSLYCIALVPGNIAQLGENSIVDEIRR